MDNRVMNRQEVEFIATADGWKTMKTTTGTTINAGNYHVSLQATDDNLLEVDYLEIQ